MSKLALVDVNKYFKQVHAVKDVSFEVEQGEFVSLLGPSGCGKTTTLRMIAGFEEVTSGSVYLGDKDVTLDPPFHRNTGMVFQTYALFPHMTVEQNIAFGLRMRKFDKAEIPRRVQEVLSLIHLEGYEERMPRQLSGGQQQRIALARALAIEPEVLLLDEPLSNLDAKLREGMRIEIKRIQQEIGITTVFVTHDQEEALILSDRVFVMNKGEVVEEGTPMDIYSRPNSTFAGMFIGHSNALNAVVEEIENDQPIIRSEGGLVFRSTHIPDISPGDRVMVLVRQERMRLSVDENGGSPDPSINSIPAELSLVTFLGPTIEYICFAGGQEIKVRRPNEGSLPVVSSGQMVHLQWDPNDCIVIKI